MNRSLMPIMGHYPESCEKQSKINLKAGELKAIVATNSLELGIDIGALDEVILVQSPPAISAGIQRVGEPGIR